jgi:hypothetical protein
VNSMNRKRLPENKVSGTWARLILVMSEYRPVAWLAFLTASPVLFITWMPSQMRIIIWHGLVARGILLGMLLVFSLRAVSLVWSVGQRVDVWAFLFINQRGLPPLWMDRTMLVFTQLGTGIAAMAIGLVLFFAGDRLVASKLILGTLTLWIAVELVKALVRWSRPFVRVTQARIVGSRATGRSFPSGHTSQAFFMRTLIARHFHASPLAVLLLFSVASIIGITHMYVGTICAMYWRGLSWAVSGDFWGCLSMGTR